MGIVFRRPCLGVELLENMLNVLAALYLEQVTVFGSENGSQDYPDSGTDLTFQCSKCYLLG